MRLLYQYVHAQSKERIEIFVEHRSGVETFLIREGAVQDSVTTDEAAVEHYRLSLSERGFIPKSLDHSRGRGRITS